MNRPMLAARHLRLLCFSVALASLGAGCDIDQTKEGKLPEVEVNEGQVPEYDVETPDVDVHTESREVEVPEVELKSEKKQIEVPDVDVDLPHDDE